MLHSTYLLLLLLFLFTEAVLLLIHYQTHEERTRQIRSFLDMENDKLEKKIEMIRLAIIETQRDLDNKKYEMGSIRPA